jgi:L-glutamine-phosphate cytidylyltransferase
MRGIILAAGRGSRLQELTQNKPKCLVELEGRPLLLWQIDALRQSGVDDITVVTGYKDHMINALASDNHFGTRHNPIWERTNMVSTLHSVRDLFTETCIVSYSDIIYEVSVPEKLIATKTALGVVYDEAWLSLWSRRFDNPLDDAESFRIASDGSITDIGKKMQNVEAIQGQYIGLLRIDSLAMKWITNIVESEPDHGANLDMTSLLQLIISKGFCVKGIPISGNWCEIDTPKDLVVAQELSAEGKLFGRF